MHKRLHRIIFLSLAVVIVFAGIFLVDELPHANAAIRVVEAQTVVEPVYDFYSDDSYQKYLSADTPFSDIGYVPGDLLPINSSFTANSSKAYRLREEAGIQFADMAWHFRNDFKGDKLWIASTYRSNDLQEYMLKKGCSRARCALAGTSEHQGGLAIDLKVVSKGGKGYSLYSGSKYYEWLANNAHKWGFHNSYQKGIEVDGQMVEAWHRRYLGTGFAAQLRGKKMTFAQYHKSLMKVAGWSVPAITAQVNE